MPRRDKPNWSAGHLAALTATDLFDLADGQRHDRPDVYRLLQDAASADLRGDRNLKYRKVLEVNLAMGAGDE